MNVRCVNSQPQWEETVCSFGAHPLQSWQWGQLKAHGGTWTAYRLVCEEGARDVGGAQVLVRRLPLPFRALAYVPRGPFFSDEALLPAICDALADWCAHNTASVCLRIEPEVKSLALPSSWRPGSRVLLAKTATVDITLPEDQIMKSIPNRKCRQYIRKAERDGVVVRPATAADMDQILALYHATAEADGFELHVDDYYRSAFELLEGTQQLFVAQACDSDELQAFLWNVLTPGGTTFELWGAVSEAGKRSRANYYLKWHAMCEAKRAGSVLYDLNGLLNDGISDFKLLFAKEPTYWAETQEKPLNALYKPMLAAFELRSSLLDLRDRLKGREPSANEG